MFQWRHLYAGQHNRSRRGETIYSALLFIAIESRSFVANILYSTTFTGKNVHAVGRTKPSELELISRDFDSVAES